MLACSSLVQQYVSILDDNLIRLRDIRDEIYNLRSHNAEEASKEVSVIFIFLCLFPLFSDLKSRFQFFSAPPKIFIRGVM